MNEITIYTDGACSGNPGKGGWGAILIYAKEEKYLSGSNQLTTNNQMELTATIEALKAIKYPSKIKSVKLEKNPILEGELLGIKGQYLLLDEDRVFNIRSHEGYIAEFSYQSIEKQGLLF